MNVCSSGCKDELDSATSCPLIVWIATPLIKQKVDRAAYTDLFATGEVERTYVARANVSSAPPQRDWLVENRVEREPGSFRMKMTAGQVNARTRIHLREIRDGRGHFELQPRTGKKHQLRLHLMSLGFPILHDPFYPELRPATVDFSQPMQLLASELGFLDPVGRTPLSFKTQRKLLF
jgi:tRNA pseudouridine32 synthase / 23S rRNA pseudouridine746 synthase